MTKDSEPVATMTQGQREQSARYKVGDEARLCPWPSKEAREEHRGPWLAVCTEDGTACMGRFRPDIAWFMHTGEHILTSEDSFVRFWPCDENGNKVRWPTNEAGEML